MEAEHGNLAYDSERQYLGTVYAKALMAAAGEQAIESVLDELQSIVEQVLPVIATLDATLASPRVGLAEKEALIDKAFAGGSKTLVNFLKVVCQHGRFDSIRVIYRTARAIYDEQSGRITVTLITASEANDGLKERIAEKLSATLDRKVRLQAKIDPEVLGGIVVKVGDTVYDGSISNQLKQVRDAAVEKSMQQIRETLDRFVVDA